MKKLRQQIILGISAILICALLSGCTIGEYRLFDTFEDEDGEQHFMLFGEIGPSGGEGG